MTNFAVGIDVGGTNIKLGLVNRLGKVVARSRLTTKSFSRNKTKLIAALCQAVTELLDEHNVSKKNVSGIGIGLPGLIDPQKGIVRLLPNIPGWRNVPLKKLIQQKLKIPTYLDNDVNLITLAEWKFGAGKGCRNLVCLTLGTGVGGGLILDNHMYRGEGFVAGEIGHMLLNEKGASASFDGGCGYLEHYIGNKQLGAKASKIFKQKGLHPHDVHAFANQDNPRALQFWEEVGGYLGNTLVNVVNLLNPSLIIIGGGVANNFKFFSPRVKKLINERAMTVHKKMVKVARAKLGDDAGIIGAKVLIEESQLER